MEKKKFEIPSIAIKHFECMDVINASTADPDVPVTPPRDGDFGGNGDGFAKIRSGKVSWD